MAFRWWLYKLTFPLSHWTIGRRVFDDQEWLMETQYWPGEQLTAMRDARLRGVVKRAYEDTRYYREVMDRAGLKPGDVCSIDDLHKLPILEKDVLRERLDELSTGESGALLCATSGSTGTPMNVWRSKRQLEVAWAVTARAFGWAGWRFGDPCVRLWHQSLRMRPTQIVREYIDAALVGRRFIPAYWMDDKHLLRGYKLIRDSGAVLLDGYADALVIMADFVKRSSLQPLCVRGVISSAAVLAAKHRVLIEEYLCDGKSGAVIDKYGAREFSGIAYECSAHEGYHIMAEQLVVEVVDGNGHPCEGGDVLITDLWNTATPLIRYSLGDLAVMADGKLCSCGRSLPLMDRIQGRTQGIIDLCDGTKLPAGFWARFFSSHLNIKRYRVEQSNANSIEIFIVPHRERWHEAHGIIDQCEHELRRYIRDTPMRLMVVREQDLPRAKTGKFITVQGMYD